MLALAFCAIASVAPHQAGQDRDASNRESVIRQLVLATYSRDVQAFNRITIEHPLRSRLTTGGSPNSEGLRRMKEDPESLQIREQRPVLFKGKPVLTGAPPVGSTAFYIVAHQGGPMVVPMVKRPEGWKVDVRWWIAGQQMSMSSVPPTQEHNVIRALLAAMLDLDKSEAAKYLTDAKGLDVLFVGAPRSREPSGVLEAAVMEMPLVEVGTGEFYALPTGKVVEGGSTETRKVIVGLFGPVEIPFVVARVGGSWRVQPEPYFMLMLQ